jgi:hypothetical protein
LESSRGVAETKRDHIVFVFTKFASKGSFPLISFSNSEEVIGVREVKTSEDFCRKEFVEDLSDEG